VSTIDSLSVIIPAFNEAQSLRGALAEIVRELGRLGIPFEIIVVDDGSDDGSVDLLSKLSSAEPRVKVLRHVSNRGKGSALRTGLAAAAFEWILFIDADLQVPLRELVAFDRATRDADILIGYRCNKKYAFKRSIISAIYKYIVRILFGINVRDVGCPFKLLRATVVRSIQLSTNGFGFDVELLWRLFLAGARFIEIPVESLPRQAGESKVTMRRIVLCLVELIQLWLRKYKTA
jgi:glycosyltransferase involved in cell wall biosynthesis